MGIAAGLLTLSFSMAAQSQAKELPLPAFPANFEVAEYQGQKGCIPDNDKYHFAVMENEGMVPAGFHPLMDAPEVGVHMMELVYNSEKDYGYTISKKNDGKLCVYNKLKEMKFKGEVTNVFVTVSEKSSITAQECSFDSKAVNICGSYEAIVARMTKAGYQFNWQGDIGDDYKLTMLSKGQQSFYLKTDKSNGATIITSIGKGAYKHYDAPSANRG